MFIAAHVVFAQQSQQIGLIRNTSQSFNGYTLFAPDFTTTYLIDNCGRTVKTWQSQYIPGQSAYLLEDGSLFRPARTNASRTFTTGGTGGRLERYDWNGTMLWGYDYTGATFHQHHDAVVLPNGNVLLISWDSKTRDEATAAGRRQYPQNGLWSEKIVELRPVGRDSAVVVWEWKLWDHLVQDNDATKANYGAVSERPERLDVNFTNKTMVTTDWIHFNGLAYNAELDQIIVSSRELSEIYIIDHSTTSAEAASTRGGRQGKGGDFLWRWGNPQAYKRGTADDRKLFGQHNPQWIAKGLPGAGNILLYNNGDNRPDGAYSTIEEVQSPVNSSGGYAAPASNSAAFAPSAALWTYKANPTTSFYSSHISGAQRLQNGNTLICEGSRGKFFEVTPTGSIVWEYRNPVGNTGPVAQGSTVMMQNVFRCLRYASNYAAFAGKTLTPGTVVELNPAPSTCTITSVKDEREEANDERVKISPNPAQNLVIVKFTLKKTERVSLKLFNALGQEVAHILDAELGAGEHTYQFDAQNLAQASQMLFIQLRTQHSSLKTIPLQVLR
ncbi:MAG: aryl-sulfate sulfotransferase [Candidatus Kapabacteria bacterium]|nr:aryl-sulfate sulfotransferase [Candidatus Kapabacteria bacterium]